MLIWAVQELIESFSKGWDYMAGLRNWCTVTNKYFVSLLCKQSKTSKTKQHCPLDPITRLKIVSRKWPWDRLTNAMKSSWAISSIRMELQSSVLKTVSLSMIREPVDVFDCNSILTWQITKENFIAFSFCENFISYPDWGAKSTQLLWFVINVHNWTSASKSNANSTQELTYFSNKFLLILHISLMLVFIYCRLKWIIVPYRFLTAQSQIIFPYIT